MIFQLNVRTGLPKDSESKLVYVSWYQKNSHQLKRMLGHFRFYHYIQNLFTDFSQAMRDGEIEFCNPGEGHICINWSLKEGLEIDDIESMIRIGLDKINIQMANKYDSLYHIKHQLQLITPVSAPNSDNPYSIIGEIILDRGEFSSPGKSERKESAFAIAN
jgi:hypothetical protein